MEEREYKEMLSTLTIVKRVLFSLVFLVLLLSISFNLYLTFKNNELNKALNLYVGTVKQMEMRYQVEQNLFRDLLNYAKDKPDLQKLLKKYNITKEALSGGAKTP